MFNNKLVSTILKEERAAAECLYTLYISLNGPLLKVL